MTSDTESTQDRLRKVIPAEIRDLPPLPRVVARIVQSYHDRTMSTNDLILHISSDRALSSQILGLVKSPYYGFPKRVTVVSHAVVIFGFNTVRNLALCAGVGNAFNAAGKTALGRKQFWTHSVASAICSRAIARRRNFTQAQSDEAFIGGLLHDIGKLFLDQYFPNQYAVTLNTARVNETSLIDAESASLGIDHALVGKLVGEKWHFPSSLVAMIAFHHRPSLAKDDFEHVAIVHAANRVAHKLALGDGGDTLVAPLDPYVENWLSFTPAAWDAIELETLDKFEQATDMVAVLCC